MICAFHILRRPRSANKQPSKAYTDAIVSAARAAYAGPAMQQQLYSRIIWFHRYRSPQGDADNIAKRIHDALKGILYTDDQVVSRTVSIRVDASESVDIVSSTETETAAAELAIRLTDTSIRDILYRELGILTDRRTFLGPVL